MNSTQSERGDRSARSLPPYPPRVAPLPRVPPKQSGAARIETGFEKGFEKGIKGRGSANNPANRFERLHYSTEPGEVDESATDFEHAIAKSSADAQGVASSGAAPASTTPPGTLYLEDPSRTVLSRNQSPDVPFDVSLNPYRGCEHGCTYCYARPTHEYLGFSAGLDFESRILVKRDAPELLRRALSARSWTPRVIAMSGVTDPYQPVERETRITRRCLEVLGEFRNPVGIVTKSALVTRDVDLLRALAEHDAVSVRLSITTLDPRLHRVMEPRASTPSQRLRAVRTLADAGIPVSVMLAPVIPGLTDHEIPAILDAVARAGARSAHYLMVRLPYAVAPLFEAWLARHYPERAGKVLGRLRAIRSGRLNDPRFGSRMRGEGVFAEQIEQLFRIAARRFGLDRPHHEPSAEHFQRPGGAQLDLFGVRAL